MATDQPTRNMEDRLLVIETKVDNLTDRLGHLENHVDSRFNSMDARLNSIESRLTLILVSTLAAVFAGFGGLIAAVFFR